MCGIATGMPHPLGLVIVVFFGLALPIQLPFARSGKLLPGLGHLFELLAVRRQRGARHVTAFGGVLEILVQFLQEAIRLSSAGGCWAS